MRATCKVTMPPHTISCFAAQYKVQEDVHYCVTTWLLFLRNCLTSWSHHHCMQIDIHTKITHAVHQQLSRNVHLGSTHIKIQTLFSMLNRTAKLVVRMARPQADWRAHTLYTYSYCVVLQSNQNMNIKSSSLILIRSLEQRLHKLMHKDLLGFWHVHHSCLQCQSIINATFATKIALRFCICLSVCLSVHPYLSCVQ